MVGTHPRIAVFMPAYNASKTIERAIASLNANREPHDIVIVDDGSEPPLSSWLASQPNMVILRAPINGGVAKARNIGLSYILEHGYDFMACLDADDFAMPDRLEKQRAFLDSHSDVGVLGTWGRFLSETGGVVFHLHHPIDHKEILQKMYYNASFINVSLMIRTSILRKIGGYDESFQVAQDYEICRRLALHTKMANLPEYLVDCTMLSSGLSVSKRRRQVRARMRVQWRYRNLFSVHFYMGMLRSLVLYSLPIDFITGLKSMSKKYKVR